MQIAMIAAEFTADEADQLRRAMAAWKRKGGLGKFHDKLVERHGRNGATSAAFAEAIFKQILGFGEYGFPESHAASFALLVVRELLAQAPRARLLPGGAARFAADGLLRPSQLVQDARRHGVEVRPVDVTASEIDSSLEARAPDAPRMPPGTDARYADRLRQCRPARRAPGPAPRRQPQRGRRQASSRSTRAGAFHQHRRPRAARRTRRQGHGGAGRGRCADVALGPPPPAGVGRHRPAPRARLAQGRADPRARACNCPPRPRARRSSATTPRSASRCAAIRSRCCARGWPA